MTNSAIANNLGSERLAAIRGKLPAILGGIKKIEPVGGGVVSHVFRVDAQDGNVFLKVRGESFAAIPEIPTDPGHILAEKQAIEVLGKIIPDYIPQLIYYDDQLKFLLLSDVMPGAVNLEERYKHDSVSAKDVMYVGRALADIHRKTDTVRIAIRGDKELQFGNQEIAYLAEHLDNDFYRSIVEGHCQKNDRLILGDVSPKNIFVRDGRVRFCDLETVRLGAVEFDQAWLVAHVLLHSYDYADAREKLAAVINGYRINRNIEENDKFFLGTLMITLIHRLTASMIPYELNLSPYKRLQTAAAMANDNGIDISMDKVLNYMFKSR